MFKRTVVVICLRSVNSGTSKLVSFNNDQPILTKRWRSEGKLVDVTRSNSTINVRHYPRYVVINLRSAVNDILDSQKPSVLWKLNIL